MNDHKTYALHIKNMTQEQVVSDIQKKILQMVKVAKNKYSNISIESVLQNNDLIRIIENNGSLRPHHYHLRSNLIEVVPKNGDSTSKNRYLRQPPVPSINNTSIKSVDTT